MLILEAAAALLLILASALVILAVVAADGWEEAEHADEGREEAARWQKVA